MSEINNIIGKLIESIPQAKRSAFLRYLLAEEQKAAVGKDEKSTARYKALALLLLIANATDLAAKKEEVDKNFPVFWYLKNFIEQDTRFELAELSSIVKVYLKLTDTSLKAAQTSTQEKAIEGVLLELKSSFDSYRRQYKQQPLMMTYSFSFFDRFNLAGAVFFVQAYFSSKQQLLKLNELSAAEQANLSKVLETAWQQELKEAPALFEGEHDQPASLPKQMTPSPARRPTFMAQQSPVSQKPTQMVSPAEQKTTTTTEPQTKPEAKPQEKRPEIKVTGFTHVTGVNTENLPEDFSLLERAHKESIEQAYQSLLNAQQKKANVKRPTSFKMVSDQSQQQEAEKIVSEIIRNVASELREIEQNIKIEKNDEKIVELNAKFIQFVKIAYESLSKYAQLNAKKYELFLFVLSQHVIYSCKWLTDRYLLSENDAYLNHLAQIINLYIPVSEAGEGEKPLFNGVVEHLNNQKANAKKECVIAVENKLNAVSSKQVKIIFGGQAQAAKTDFHLLQAFLANENNNSGAVLLDGVLRFIETACLKSPQTVCCYEWLKKLHQKTKDNSELFDTLQIRVITLCRKMIDNSPKSADKSALLKPLAEALKYCKEYWPQDKQQEFFQVIKQHALLVSQSNAGLDKILDDVFKSAGISLETSIKAPRDFMRRLQEIKTYYNTFKSKKVDSDTLLRAEDMLRQLCFELLEQMAAALGTNNKIFYDGLLSIFKNAVDYYKASCKETEKASETAPMSDFYAKLKTQVGLYQDTDTLSDKEFKILEKDILAIIEPLVGQSKIANIVKEAFQTQNVKGEVSAAKPAAKLMPSPMKKATATVTDVPVPSQAALPPIKPAVPLTRESLEKELASLKDDSGLVQELLLPKNTDTRDFGLLLLLHVKAQELQQDHLLRGLLLEETQKRLSESPKLLSALQALLPKPELQGLVQELQKKQRSASTVKVVTDPKKEALVNTINERLKAISEQLALFVKSKLPANQKMSLHIVKDISRHKNAVAAFLTINACLSAKQQTNFLTAVESSALEAIENDIFKFFQHISGFPLEAEQQEASNSAIKQPEPPSSVAPVPAQQRPLLVMFPVPQKPQSAPTQQPAPAVEQGKPAASPLRKASVFAQVDPSELAKKLQRRQGDGPPPAFKKE